MEDFKENAIEFLTGEHYATVSFTARKEINRVCKIYETRSSEFKYFEKNKDGTICARIPKRWIKINPGADPNSNKPKRSRSPEQIEKSTKVLAEWRLKNKKR